MENKIFKKFSDIQKIDESKLDLVKSNLLKLDTKIRGFVMGEITVVSGLNGSGKSNLLMQEMLYFGMQGYKTLLFSGEIQNYKIKNILIRMVAGFNNLQASQDGTFFYPKNETVQKKAEEWIEDKFVLYNNECSMKSKDIIEAIKYIVKNGAKIIILDNLMTMDLRDLDKDKYEAQSIFIKQLANLSKSLKIHIFIVMHPRKVMGFLRKDDISGTADLTNAVDNVLIVHRNNMDFQKRSTETFGNKLEQSGIYNYDNVIEVCKNRLYGVQDYFVGLYYEKETKRFVERKGENYGYIYQAGTIPF